MPRLVAGVVALVGVVGVTVLVTIPFFAKDRRLPAVVVQPSPLFSTALIAVAPDQEACIRDAAIDRYSEVALFQVATKRKPGVPLEFTVKGAGYAQKVRQPGDYADNDIVSVRIDPPERPTTVSVCIRNQGKRQIELYGTGDTSAAPVRTELDGARTQNFNLAFYEAEEVSLWKRKHAVAERAGRFRPVGEDTVLLLAALVVAVVPVALALALVLSVRRRREA